MLGPPSRPEHVSHVIYLAVSPSDSNQVTESGHPNGTLFELSNDTGDLAADGITLGGTEMGKRQAVGV